MHAAITRKLRERAGAHQLIYAIRNVGGDLLPIVYYLAMIISNEANAYTHKFLIQIYVSIDSTICDRSFDIR